MPSGGVLPLFSHRYKQQSDEESRERRVPFLESIP